MHPCAAAQLRSTRGTWQRRGQHGRGMRGPHISAARTRAPQRAARRHQPVSRSARVQARASYVPFRSYSQSKLANIMCAHELQRRCDALQLRLGVTGPAAAPGSDPAHPPSLVTCTNTHPGLVNTPLARTYFETDWISVAALRPVLAPVMRAVFPYALLQPELCVGTVALAALGPAGEVRGKFVEGGRAAPLWARACLPRESTRLWAVSLDLARMRDPLV